MSVAQAGSQCAFSQNCQRATSAQRRGSVWTSPASGFFAARYCMIAFDSQRTKPSSSRTGIFWLGLSAVNSGVICTPFSRSTGQSSKSSPR